MRRALRHLDVLLVMVVLAFATLTLSGRAAAEARPGGGQSYHGGGSSGGGHSSGGGSFGGGHSSSGGGSSGGFRSSGGSSSGGSGYSSSSTSSPGGVFVLLLGGLIVLVVVIGLSRAQRQNTSVRSAILSAQYDQEARSRRGASIDLLRARDPNLTEQSIVDRVRRMSDVLREAWIQGNMAPARAFVSDGVYSRFQVQLALMRQEGVRNVMSDAAVLYVTMEAVQSSPPLDAVHVRFTAQARDATVPLDATLQQIQAALRDTDVVPYTEIWTLVRRQGAQTKLDPSQVGKACPACGAPFDVGGGEILTCKHCKALVCSGEHDWVLAEITQLEEWHPTSADAVLGLEELRQVDLGAAREVLEDRASYLFWKWVEAGRFATPAPLKKAATPALLARGGDGPQLVAKAKDLAVGGANLLFVDLARDEAEDYVYVNVFWSARFVEGAEPMPRQAVLRLARKTGASSKLSMSSVVCPSCGAPLTETDDPRCAHCGTEIVASGMVWALDGVLPPGAPRLRYASALPALSSALVPDVRDPRERQVLFVQMAQLMARSGGLARDEKRLLTLVASRWSIAEDLVAKALDGKLGGVADVGPVASPEWFLAGLVGAALADGHIDAKEMETLVRTTSALGLAPEVLQQQIASAQQRIAQAPRA